MLYDCLFCSLHLKMETSMTADKKHTRTYACMPVHLRAHTHTQNYLKPLHIT